MGGLEPSFFCAINQILKFPTTEFHKIRLRHVNSCHVEAYHKGFSKKFRLGVFVSKKPQNYRRSNRYLTLTSYSSQEAL